MKSGKETENAVRFALETGYRHIDTAAMYGNEQEVGKAVKNSGITREEIFVTTKVWNSDHGYNRTLRAFDESMRRLDIGYIDLYLIHWPVSGLRLETWKALQKLYADGKCRSIGVSNFTIRHLNELMASFDIVPAVNQVEFHAYLYQKNLLEYCNSKGIIVESYCPITRGKRLNDKRLEAIAGKYSKTPAQVLIRWTLQKGTVTLPKSTHENRIRENFNIFDFELSIEDMNEIDSFNEDYRITWDPTNIV
jgi:diketogulonate reductase-like aldo/keto reductase